MTDEELLKLSLLGLAFTTTALLVQSSENRRLRSRYRKASAGMDYYADVLNRAGVKPDAFDSIVMKNFDI